MQIRLFGILTALIMGYSIGAQAQSLANPSAQVQALVQKHYGGYSAGGDPAATFAQTAQPSWANCGANGATCQTRDELVAALHGLHKLIPNMKWEVLDIMVAGDKVIVRGKGSGQPVGEFMGIPANGKGFQIMSIDIHTLKNGKIVETYHLEDWVTAIGQLASR